MEIFKNPVLHKALAFRGGTALHKLFFDPPGRYSEDIDLVQRKEGPIGPVIDAIRNILYPWLGEPRRKQGQGQVTILYRFDSTALPVRPMRLKVEINTREHFAVLGLGSHPFTVDNPWFSGESDLPVFAFEELMATKLRALYQRKKGRDLYDLWLAVQSQTHKLNRQQVIHCFQKYMGNSRTSVSRAQFEDNLKTKVKDQLFRKDLDPLLPTGTQYDVETAAKAVLTELIALVPGSPWKGEDNG